MTNETKNTETTTNFEENMKELEVIVRRLEAGNVPLEESIKLYQRGLELYGVCFEKLKNAEELIVKIDEEE